MASRKEEKERLRREREERERAAASGAHRRRLIGYGVGGVLALAALVALGIVVLTSGGASGGGESEDGRPRPTADLPSSPVPPPRETDFAKAGEAAGCVSRRSPSEGRGHTTSSVRYRSNPPTSGRHHPVAADDGAYAENPGTEHLVHALEHGRIIYQFRPSAPERLRGQLKSLFDEDPYHVILVPNPDMPYEVAATAWTEMLGCRQANDRVFDALRAFKQRNRDRGPEFVQ
jgi:hypothetical protein